MHLPAKPRSRATRDSLAEISDAKNDFSLNFPPRYIDSSEPEDLQDLDAHLRDGIHPELRQL